MPESITPKIAFVSIRQSYIKDGLCYYDGPNGRLIQAILNKYPDLTLVTYPASEKKPYYNLPIRPKKVYSFPFSNSFSDGIRNMWKAMQLLRRIQKENDVLIIQLPFKSFLAPLLIYKPVIYHLCINVKTAAANPIKYRGWKALLSNGYASLIQGIQKAYLWNPRAHLIANGKELAMLFQKKKTTTVVSASLFDQEMIPASRLDSKSFGYRLLFVGRPDRVKGFDTLLEAITSLIPSYPQLTLTCIGFTEEEFQETWANESARPIVKNIRFLGALPFSEKLFHQYGAHDILVLPSRSEGTPRVLVEARAFGCMVVASNVDGIPSSVNNGVDGLLFSPGDVSGLIRQLERIFKDPNLQKTLLLNGLKTAKQITIESFASAFFEAIRQVTNND